MINWKQLLIFKIQHSFVVTKSFSAIYELHYPRMHISFLGN